MSFRIVTLLVTREPTPTRPNPTLPPNPTPCAPSAATWLGSRGANACRYTSWMAYTVDIDRSAALGPVRISAAMASSTASAGDMPSNRASPAAPCYISRPVDARLLPDMRDDAMRLPALDDEEEPTFSIGIEGIIASDSEPKLESDAACPTCIGLPTGECITLPSGSSPLPLPPPLSFYLGAASRSGSASVAVRCPCVRYRIACRRCTRTARRTSVASTGTS